MLVRSSRRLPWPAHSGAMFLVSYAATSACHHVQMALGNGLATGIGSLPHRDADVAARFALSSLELPTIPTLPKRSPAEGAVAQAIVGLNGVSIGHYGSIAVEARLLDPAAPVHTDMSLDSFGGFRAFLDHAVAVGYTGPVKWQFVGPVTLGAALVRAGAPHDLAFDVAANAVRSHLIHLHRLIETALPGSEQVVFVDEPELEGMLEADFVLAPDVAIDHVSMAMSSLEGRVTVGVHSCGAVDIPSVLATGPQVLAVPLSAGVLDAAGYLAKFMDGGGVIAWGAVPTEGPLTASVERPWRALNDVWCGLVERGVDPSQLRTQSLVTPECGLSAHSTMIAERIHRLTVELGERVRDHAVATRFNFGA